MKVESSSERPVDFRAQTDHRLEATARDANDANDEDSAHAPKAPTVRFQR